MDLVTLRTMAHRLFEDPSWKMIVNEVFNSMEGDQVLAIMVPSYYAGMAEKEGEMRGFLFGWMAGVVTAWESTQPDMLVAMKLGINDLDAESILKKAGVTAASVEMPYRPEGDRRSDGN